MRNIAGLRAIVRGFTSGPVAARALNVPAVMTIFRCRSCGALNRAQPGRALVPVCGRCQSTIDTSGAPQPIDGAALAEAVDQSEVPLLVDFWASWCMPCRMIAPTIDGIARERAGDLIVLKLDTEGDARAAAAHQIRSIPTLILFRGRREIGRLTGALPKREIDRWIDEQLQSSERVARA